MTPPPLTLTQAATRPPSAGPSAARSALLSVSALVHVMVVSAVVALTVSLWLLIGLDGRRYYTTPLGVRGYDPMHAVLRPSGPVGQSLGVAGALLLLVPFAYMLRKRFAKAKGVGNLKTLLEVHIFCGIVGPVLITYHTAFKFNGLVSVAYWSMVLVALSGFVGRYLYVRIPRTIRGAELSEAELASRAQALREDLQWHVDPAVMVRVEAFERHIGGITDTAPSLLGLLTGGRAIARRVHAVRRELVEAGASAQEAADLAAALGARASLLRRLQYLQPTRRLFALWHVFHLPLVYVMFVIVGLHIGIVLYLGYVPFRW
jgi:hypothetical protein